MRKRTLGVVLLAGLAMSGAGAFTASNTVADSVAGYGEAAVTGVTVTDTSYTLHAVDKSSVTVITFTHAEDLTGLNVVLGLQDNNVDVVAPNTCVGGALSTVCTFTALTGQAIDSFDELQLTVVQ